MGWRAVGFAFVCLAIGCADESGEVGAHVPPPMAGCAAPNRVVGDRCLEPGVQENGCAAGTLARDDGSCQPAGVPPELCAEGFVHDGAASCEPILPSSPCSAGEMAIPGERTCRPVMPCGAGAWGDIPVDATTVYVDAGYLGLDSDGTADKPWTSLVQALNAAPAGALVAIASGSYPGYLEIETPVRIWGVCPDRVELMAPMTALFFGPDASGSEVHGVAVRAGGIAVSGAEDVMIDRVWVHDALGGGGLNVGNALGTTSVRVENSLFDANEAAGVFAEGSDVTLDGVVVRGTRPSADSQAFGRGLNVQLEATLTLRRSVVEHNRDSGIFVFDSDATLEGIVVRDTLPQASDAKFGRGLDVTRDAARPRSLLVKSSSFEGNRDAAVLVTGAEATLEGIVVRDTLARASDDLFGRGISIEPEANSAPSVALRSSLVEGNREIGIFASGSPLTIEGVVARGTLPRASDNTWGRGVSIQSNPDATELATAAIEGSVIENNHEVGIIVSGAEATVKGVVIRGTQVQANGGGFGEGLNIQFDELVGERSTVLVDSCVIEDNHSAGVVVAASEATLDAIVLRSNLPDLAQLFGDGLAVFSTEQPIAAMVSLTHARVERNARGGVTNFAAIVALGNSLVTCNAFELNAENEGARIAAFDNLGGNLCGCPEPREGCAAVSSGLVPPALPPP